MLIHLATLPAAFLLDLLIGDPRRLPHPVRWMGAAIDAAEPVFRGISLPLRGSGALFAATLVLSAFGISWAVVTLAYRLHPSAGFLVETLCLFYCLSVRSLADSALRVSRSLGGNDLTGARGALAMIVGRETASLDPPAIRRAVVETVSENLVDGVMAPLFYGAIGGAPLALAYKMVNTLDSMVGYKNDRYAAFGWASARLDDAAGFLPARGAIPIIAAAAAILLKKGRQALATALREGRKHTSPNAGWPEAAFAGALGIRLGGPSTYHGKRVEKPWLGESGADPQPVHLTAAVDLMVLSAGLGFWVCWILSACRLVT
jgi:adenosylcobinamide-phosphate synthase